MSTSSFPDSLDDSVPTTESTHPFTNADSIFVEESTFAPPLPPPYNNNFADSEFVDDSVDDSAIFSNSVAGDDDAVFRSDGFPAENGVFVAPDAPILPSHDEMQEDGFALREWRRQNAIRLEQKEKREKEILSQIIEEANEYKVAFHEKRKAKCESNITDNREKEKLVLANIEKFHKEADKNYWKSIAELIPNEVPVIKKRGKKEAEKKPSIAVIQGPKPGKPTDLARMRQILIKLKHDTPGHLKLAPPANKDAKSDSPSRTETVAAATPAVVAA